MNLLPLLGHPTRTLFLDDQRSFLEHVDAGLDGEIGEIELFDDPDLALDWIEKNGIVRLDDGDGIQLLDDANDPEEKLLSIQIQNLQEKTLNLGRLNKSVVAIVDYQLGSTRGATVVDGVDWCRKVSNPYVQKILLTGVADEKIGIDALNNGWIDQYVRKQDPNMLEKLKEAIKRAHRRSFALLTQGLHFAITQAPDDTALSDPAFGEFFFKLLEKEGVFEHYLIDAMGSFLIIDKHGRRRCLFVQTKAKAESNLQFLDGWIKDDPIKNDLENGRKIICCPSSKSFVSPNGADYNSYLFSANILNGRQTYYWAVTPELR